MHPNLYNWADLHFTLYSIPAEQRERERSSGLTWNHFSPPLSIFRVAMETQSLLGFWSSGHSRQRDGTGNHLLSRALPHVSLLWPRSHGNREHSKTVDCHQRASSIPFFTQGINLPSWPIVLHKRSPYYFSFTRPPTALPIFLRHAGKRNSVCAKQNTAIWHSN